MGTWVLIFECLLLPLISCAMSKNTPQKDEHGKLEHLVLTGMASWYGNEFKGHKTSSGERYDPQGLTAAHRSLPFGTLVRVTVLRNQKSVIVRITNRGPFIKHRIIDVSRAAAIKLDMIHSGVARVRIEVLVAQITEPVGS